MAILVDRASTDVESAAQELVEPTRDQQAALDAALEGHALTGLELDSKLHVIEWLRERVSKRSADFRRSLEEGRTRGRAALRRAWDALIDGLNGVVGSIIPALAEAGLGTASRGPSIR
jgi:hypothetical protein